MPGAMDLKSKKYLSEKSIFVVLTEESQQNHNSSESLTLFNKTTSLWLKTPNCYLYLRAWLML